MTDASGHDPSLEITVRTSTPVSRDALWAAWRDPASIARWWGPDGFTSTVRELEVRTGGRLEVVMHGPDGTDFENTYVFDAVDEPGRLVYTNQGSEEWGLAPFTSVMDFDVDGTGSEAVTRITLTCQYASPEEYRKHVEDFHSIDGAQQLIERMARIAGDG